MATASATNSILEELSTCLPKIRVPALGDNVHKEECCLSFDTPVRNTLQSPRLRILVYTQRLVAFSGNFQSDEIKKE